MGSIRPAGDRRAVTPVVGIALLIALTVMIAATVAAFVFTMDDDVRPRNAPTASFDFEFESGGSDAVTIVHQSGDAIATSLLYVQVDGAECVGGPDDPNRRLNVAADWGLSGEFTAGRTIRVARALPSAADLCSSGDLDLRDATVHVVWESGEGTSRELQSWHGPG